MDTELQTFLAEVEAYLADTGLSHSTFGKNIFKDGAVVRRMREGRAITTKSMSAMRRFMEANPPPTKSVDAI